MPSVDDIYPSAFIKAATLQGKEVTLTIKSAEAGKVGQGEEAKGQLVLEFEETEKKFGLNRTNVEEIAGGYGRDYGEWNGRQVVLYPTTTNYPAPGTPCVRVRVVREAVDGDKVPF
jgi:hypothetical protein